MVKMAKVDNPRYPHGIRITRASRPQTGVDDPFSESVENEVKVIYDGAGRNYTDTTTTGSGKVEDNKRKVSIPVRFDKWEQDGFPLDGDEMEVSMGNVTEKGTVKDFEPDNNRSVVYWELLRV